MCAVDLFCPRQELSEGCLSKRVTEAERLETVAKQLRNHFACPYVCLWA
jgi:hypothetical protein